MIITKEEILRAETALYFMMKDNERLGIEDDTTKEAYKSLRNLETAMFTHDAEIELTEYDHIAIRERR